MKLSRLLLPGRLFAERIRQADLDIAHADRRLDEARLSHESADRRLELLSHRVELLRAAAGERHG